MRIDPYSEIKDRQKPWLLPGNNHLMLVGVLGAAFFGALFFGISIGQENYFQTYIVLLLLGGPAFLFIIKGNYWIWIPFAVRCGLPAIPLIAGKSLAVSELWVMLSTLMFAGQLLLYHTVTSKFERRELIPIYMIVMWAIMMYFREGIGLSILGSDVQGGRKYLGIFLAVAATFIIFHQKITEKQCKWLILLIVSAVGTAMFVGLVNHFVFKRTDYLTDQWSDQNYTYHQILASFPVMVIIWIFSKYSPAEIIVRMHMKMIAVLGVSYAMVLYSGKRMHLVLALTIPVIAALIRRQYASVVIYGASAVLFLSVLLVGQGNFFDLPGSMKRALSVVSYLPGVEWDASSVSSDKTNFRETLNAIAMEKIAEHPLMGNGLAVSAAEVMEFEAMEEFATEEVDSHAYKMAAGSAWHNTWLGISTDFGIPCAVVFAVFWLQIFKYAFRLRRQLPLGSYARLLVTIILIMNAGDLLQSWVAGHSLADVLWVRGWQFGVLLALKFQLESGNSEWNFKPQEDIKVAV